MSGLRTLLSAMVLAVACGPSPPAVDVEKPVVSVDPPAPLDAVPRVARLEVRGFSLPPAALALFRGELSDYYAGELRNGKVPVSLHGREVTATAWLDPEDGRTRLAPSEALVLRESYTLAVLGGRPLGAVRVADAEDVPYATRVWPPHDWPLGGGRWVFCGERTEMPLDLATRFD